MSCLSYHKLLVPIVLIISSLIYDPYIDLPRDAHLYGIRHDITNTSAKELEDLEFIENITLNLGHDGHRILTAKNVGPHGHHVPRCFLIFEQARIQHFRNAEISKWGVFVNGKGFRPACYPLPINFPVTKIHSLECYRLVVVGYSYFGTFGHFLQDILCPVLQLPCNITENAQIYFSYEINTVRRYMEFLGFDLSKVHIIREEWVRAKEMYIVKPAYYHNAMQFTFGHLHDLIYSKLDLERIPPVNHIIWNKTPGKWGHIQNIEDVLNYTKTNYPQYNWYILPWETCNNIIKLATEFAGAKLIISSSGSFSFNMIYLHRECGILVCGNSWSDGPVLAASHSLDLWMLYFAVSNFRITDKGAPMNVSELHPYLDDLIYMTYNKKYPDNYTAKYNLFCNATAEMERWGYRFQNRTNFMHVYKRFGEKTVNESSF